jgi:hypothetical protein
VRAARVAARGAWVATLLAAATGCIQAIYLGAGSGDDSAAAEIDAVASGVAPYADAGSPMDFRVVRPDAACDGCARPDASSDADLLEESPTCAEDALARADTPEVGFLCLPMDGAFAVNP